MIGILFNAKKLMDIAAMVFLMMLVTLGADNLSKDEIFGLVEENYDIIMRDINENDFSDTRNIEGVKEIYVEDGIIDVYCGGSGMGSETNYYGFYYSPDGKPLDVWCGKEYCESDNLTPEGKGFSDREITGDNYYYTEKICGNFYYYEKHF